VLLHPGQGGLVEWDPQFEEFARPHRVARYDARGFGQSDKDLTPYNNYDDLRCVLDALGMTRAGLVGLSLGGRTMLDFALAYPDRVACLVLVNPGASGYTFTGLDQYWAEIQAATDRDDVDAFVETGLRMWFDGPTRTAEQVDRQLRARLGRIERERVEQNRARLTRLGAAAKMSELSAISRLGEIRAPTLVVEANLDQPDIHTICDALVREVAGAQRVRIDGAAHMVNWEKPKEFAAAVLPFLAAHPGS
jgi:3-oxoadipate enol-lactonase